MQVTIQDSVHEFNLDDGSYCWPNGYCINPFDMVQLVHSSVFHNYCVHDGTENPLCLTIATDTWWSSIDEIMTSRNKKYKGIICGTEVVTEMIHFGMPIDIEMFVKTFDCHEFAVRSCIRKEGLKSKMYRRHGAGKLA